MPSTSSTNERVNASFLSIPLGFVRAANIPARLKSFRSCGPKRQLRAHIGTGKLNRALRAAFAANPPPMVKGKRLKLFYATQSSGNESREFAPPEIVLFVNSPRLLTQPFARFLEAKIRELEPYPGSPILLTCRARLDRHSERSRRIPSRKR